MHRKENVCGEIIGSLTLRDSIEFVEFFLGRFLFFAPYFFPSSPPHPSPPYCLLKKNASFQKTIIVDEMKTVDNQQIFFFNAIY